MADQPAGTLADRASTDLPHRHVHLALLTGLIVFSPLLEGGTTHVAVLIIRLVLLALVAAVAWRSLVAGRIEVPSPGLWPPVLTYLALAGMSVLLSPYRHQSLQWLAVLCAYGALLYLVVLLLRGWDDIAKLLVAACGIGVIEAVWALVEALWHQTARPHASFFNPNFLAGYLGAVATILLGYLCYAGRAEVRRRGWRSPAWIGTLLSFGLLVAAMLATGSRGGILAFVVGSAVVLSMRFGRRSVAIMGAILLLAILVPNPLRDRVSAEHAANPVSYARLQIWQSAVMAMIEHPMGAGLGLYQYISPQYMFPVEGQIARYGRVATTAHNEYLQMGVELGLASVVVFLWGIVLVGREAVRVLGQRLSRRQRGLVVGASAAAAGILAHAAVDSNLHEPALAILLTALVGTIFSIRSGMRRTPLPSYRVAYPKAWAGVAVVILTWLVVGAVKMGVAWLAFEAGNQAATRHALPEALADYRMAIALDSGKALYHSAAAATHFRSFQGTGGRAAAIQSISELETAIVLNPLDGRLPGLLGAVYAAWSTSQDSLAPRVDALRHAVAAYRKAAALEPFNPWHRMELGRLHMILAETPQAEEVLGEALSLEPNFLPGRALLAHLYLDSSREAEAKRQYDEIVRRQERYAQAPKDALEQQLLKVDLAPLRSKLRLGEERDPLRGGMSGA